MTNVIPVILAGGKGTRMNEGRPSPIPKVLIPLGGRPMVSYIIETFKQLSNTTIKQYNNLTIKFNKPILVVGYKGELVKKEFGKKYDYVWQKKRLGTGHAARLALNYITKISNFPVSTSQGGQFPNSKKISNSNFQNSKKNFEFRASNFVLENQNLVLILQGDDSAFYKAETLKKFILNHIKNDAVVSFLTTHIPGVKDLGRVIRDNKGNILDIVEKENLNYEQEKITEINCAGYLLDFKWALKSIKKIKKHLKKGREYPLPDIIKIALNQKKKVIAYTIPSSEWKGVNSPDQLVDAEKKIKNSNLLIYPNASN